MSTFHQILSKCSFFDKIPQDKYANVIQCLDGYRKNFKKYETLVAIGDTSRTSGIVISGTIEIIFYDEDGNQINIRHISSGEVFGAAQSCGSATPSNVSIRALSNCEILFLSFENLLRIQEKFCPYRAQVSANLLRDFAKRTVFLNHRMQIVCQKRLRDKIKVYLQTLGHDKNGYYTIPFSRAALAEYLYVDRSALSRELSRMKAENLIDYDGRTIRVLDRDWCRS